MDFSALPSLPDDVLKEERLQEEALESLRYRYEYARDSKDGEVPSPRNFAEYRFRYKRGHPITFQYRPWLPAIYDAEYTSWVPRGGGEPRNRRKTILLTARQCEKCVPLSSIILMSDGSLKLADDVQVGDLVSSYCDRTKRLVGRRVTWKSDVVRKPCLSFETKHGRSVTVATTHPLRYWDCWPDAQDVNVGEAVMVTRVPGAGSVIPAEVRSALSTLSGGRVSSGSMQDMLRQARSLRLPWDLLKDLEATMTSPDIAWDEITSIQGEGVLECVDFEVEETHNFVADGFITHNSTTLATKSTSLSCLIPNLTTLIVSSADQNLQEFVDEKLQTVLRESPHLAKHLGHMISDNKYLKRFSGNNSRIVLRSTHLSPARARGVSADVAKFDEFQDIAYEHFEVIRSVVNNSALTFGPIVELCGTPKTTDNPIQRVFGLESTQNRWLTKCSRCNHYNLAGLEQTTKHGLACEKCGKAFNPLNGQWVMHGAPDAEYNGFHLTRPMMAYTRFHRPDQFDWFWRDLWSTISSPNATEASVRNEVFGESYDDGTKPMSESSVREACHPGLALSQGLRSDLNPETPIFMGVDWGEGKGGGGSYTTLCLGYANGSKFEAPFFYRFMGREIEPDFIISFIKSLYIRHNVAHLFCDAGMGWGMIDRLWRQLPEGRIRVVPVRYTSQLQPLSYSEELHTISADKTRLMAHTINLLNRGEIWLPRWEDFSGHRSAQRGFSEDFVSVFYEYNEKTGKKTFGKLSPDDGFQCLVYANLAKQIFYSEVDHFLHM